MSWMKSQCFLRGISPREFKRMEMRDILEIFEINNAIDSKKIRSAKLQQAIAEMWK